MMICMATIVPNSRKPKRPTHARKVDKAGPSLAKLKQLAKTKRPPQKWYDETENPFEAPRK